MIDISHEQARRLAREALDRPVAEGSWSALQAHLENCAECRAYRDRRARLERSLVRALHAGWARVSGPTPGLATDLVQYISRRARRAAFGRRVTGYGGLVVAAVLALFFYSAFWRPAQPAAAPVQATPTPAATEPEAAMRQKAHRGDGFQGVVAFEAPVRGNTDILLLTAGPNSVAFENLTTSEALETAPAWSPDGEWIAFLSDRDRNDGGMDIYVMTIAGTRLTRLTADPILTWSAPLAWSPDGHWIAARANELGAAEQRGSGGTSWIYQVELNGKTPRPLPYTRGAHSPRFAPGQPLLAYVAVEGQLSFLRVYDAPAGVTHNLTRAEAAATGTSAGRRDGPGSTSVRAFDWAADGSGVVYILNRSEPERDPYWVQARWAQSPGQVPVTADALVTSRAASQELLTFPATSPVVTAGLSGEGELFYTRTYRRDGRWTSCRPLLVSDELEPSSARPGLAMPVLCIESPIERGAWSSDGRTLIAAARTTTESAPGIFALGLPEAGGTGRVVRSERLGNLPEGAGLLRVRPERAEARSTRIKIEPQAAAAPGAAAPGFFQPVLAVDSLIPPPELLSRVLLTSSQASGHTISELSPDGARRETLSGGRYGSCAARSPGGEQVAFRAWEPGEELPRLDLFRMDADGGNVVHLTGEVTYVDTTAPDHTRPVAGLYGCPVWSPDGSRLAPRVDVGGALFLVILAASGNGSALVTPLNPTGFRTPPVWTADGKAVVVFLKTDDRQGAQIARVDPVSGAVDRLLAGDGWEGAGAAAGGSNGDWVAYTVLRLWNNFEVHAGLRITSAVDGREYAGISLAPYSLFTGVEGYGGMAWLPGATGQEPPRLGLVFRGTPDGRVPSKLMVYDPALGHLSTLAVINEVVLGTAWSPDGRWLLYSTPSGLWSLNVAGALSASATPAWLSEARAVELDWR